jgi:hypothetical protein
LAPASIHFKRSFWLLPFPSAGLWNQGAAWTWVVTPLLAWATLWLGWLLVHAAAIVLAFCFIDRLEQSVRDDPPET